MSWDMSEDNRVLRERIAALEAENAALRSREAELLAANVALKARADNAIDENAALREDKARLDWLDTRLDCLEASGYGADDRWFRMLYSDGKEVEGSSVRKCIDFARKGDK